MTNENTAFLILRLRGWCAHMTRQSQSATHKTVSGIIENVALLLLTVSSCEEKRTQGGPCYFIQQGFAGSQDDISLLSQVPSLPPC